MSGWRSPSSDLVDFECFKIQRFGLAIAALRFVQFCQVIETLCGVGMVIAQFGFTDFERLQDTAVRPRHSGPASRTVLPSYSDWLAVSGWRSPSSAFLISSACTIERFGLAVAPLRVVQRCQVIETLCGVGMAIAQFGFPDFERLQIQRFGLAIAALRVVQ